MAFKHDIEVQRTNYRDLFHGEMVTVSIFETITDLRKVFNDDVQQYMITVCNEFGNSSYIEIQSSMYKSKSYTEFLILLFYAFCVLNLPTSVLTLFPTYVCNISIYKINVRS